MSSQVHFLFCLPLSQKCSVHSPSWPVAHRTPPGWEEGAGSWAGSRPAGSLGAPLGLDALQMRSHPLPPGSSVGEMREETEIYAELEGPGWAEPGWSDTIVTWGPGHLQLSPGRELDDCPSRSPKWGCKGQEAAQLEGGGDPWRVGRVGRVGRAPRARAGSPLPAPACALQKSSFSL